MSKEELRTQIDKVLTGTVRGNSGGGRWGWKMGMRS